MSARKVVALLADWQAGWTQLRHPPEFRIASDFGSRQSPAAGELATIGEELRALAGHVQRVLDAPPPQPAAPPVDDRTRMKFYTELGTGWWRIWRKLLRPGTDRPRDEVRNVFSFVESLGDVLKEAGIQVIDHTGEDYRSGVSIEVLEFQENAALTKDRVSETVRPTIYYKDRMIQMGRVYVETPPGASRSAAR
jgi:hypothetical protein